MIGNARATPEGDHRTSRSRITFSESEATHHPSLDYRQDDARKRIMSGQGAGELQAESTMPTDAAMELGTAENAELRALRGTEEDLRAMKRALARAPLGPNAILALTAAEVLKRRDAY